MMDDDGNNVFIILCVALVADRSHRLLLLWRVVSALAAAHHVGHRRDRRAMLLCGRVAGCTPLLRAAYVRRVLSFDF